jgi:hypothetical protein
MDTENNNRVHEYLLRRYGEESYDEHGPRSDSCIITGSFVVGLAAGGAVYKVVLSGANENLNDIAELKGEVSNIEQTNSIIKKNGYRTNPDGLESNLNAINQHKSKIAVAEKTVPLGGYYTESIGQISIVAAIAFAGLATYHHASTRTANALNRARQRVNNR